MKPKVSFNCIDDINLKSIMEKTAAIDYLEAANRHLCDCDNCLENAISMQKYILNKENGAEINNKVNTETYAENLHAIRKIMGSPPDIIKVVPDVSDEIKSANNTELSNFNIQKIVKKGQIWSTKYIVDIEFQNFYSTNPPYVLIIDVKKKQNEITYLKVVVCRDYNTDYFNNDHDEIIDLIDIISFDDIYLERMPFIFETWNIIEITTDVLKKSYSILSVDEFNELSNYIKNRVDLTMFNNGKNNIDFIYRNKEVDSIDYLLKRTDYIKQNNLKSSTLENKNNKRITDVNNSKKFISENKVHNDSNEIVFDLETYKNNSCYANQSLAVAQPQTKPDFSEYKTLNKLLNENKFNNLISKTEVLISVLTSEKVKTSLISKMKELYEYLKSNEILDELKESSKQLLDKIVSIK